MRSSGRVSPGWRQRGQVVGDGEAPPPRSAAAPASPSYCVVYSSDDSLSDGELHVQRRAGNLSAWYQHGSDRARPATGGSSGEEGGSPGPPHSSVRVVLHNDAAGKEGQGNADGAVSAGEGQPQASWETNNLFEHLKGLHQQGVEDAAAGGPGLDSEEWEQRSAALRALLRERDGEVAQLHRALGERAGQLAGREAEVEEQAQRIMVLQDRIQELVQQLQLQSAAAAVGSRDGYIGAVVPAPPPALLKHQLATAYQPPPTDSYCVQLPAQSYAEHSGCGFWQGVVEGVQRHPRRWAACGAAVALLLLIVLCATLIPAAQRRRAAPRFTAAPAVAATGATWLDLDVQLDRPALLSYMVFRQADLAQPVPGEGGRTLQELVESGAVSGAAVHAPSSPRTSLDPSSAPLAGLQQLAVACGWAPVLDSSESWRVSLLIAAGAGAAACAATAAPGRCARCPRLEDGTAYTLLVAAASASGSGISSVQVLNATTGATAINVTALDQPYADNATASAFDLHFKLNAPGKRVGKRGQRGGGLVQPLRPPAADMAHPPPPLGSTGTLFYAVAHDSLLAPYGAQQLAFGPLAPSAAAVVGADPSAFLGGLVANGSVEVADAGAWVSTRVDPPCLAALCGHSVHGLQGGTAYRVYLVAVDAAGNPDPVPAEAALTTAPPAAPTVLPGSGPANVTDSSFGVAVTLEAAGGVYWRLLTPRAGSDTADAFDVAPGQWRQLDSLSGSRRRLAAVAAAASGRQLRQSPAAPPVPGSLVAPVCYPANQTCSLDPAAALSGVEGSLAGYDTVAAGCSPVPEAGQPTALPAFTGLRNNTLYVLLLSSEDRAVPRPNRLAPPAAYAVRTVDLSAPALACGFPAATNITATSLALSAMLTKPGASVFYVVQPVAAPAPTATQVLQGQAGGGAPAAAGNLTRWGALPWEPAASGGASGDPRKLWAPVAGLQGGANYSAYLVVTLDGSTPAHGGAVAALSGILTPAVVPPTFTRLKGLNASVDEGRGTFSVQLSADLDRAGQVFFALYRNYSCIQGDPSAADVVAGAALPPTICKCDDKSYCALIGAGSFSVPAQTLGAVHGLGGDLSPLPFESLRNAAADQLKCFQGGLGQATDTYNIYLVAGTALPSYTGLAPQCSNSAQAVATAAAALDGSSSDTACPAARQVACAQAQLRPDTQALQSGAFAQWPANTSSSSPIVWQPPAAAGAAPRPAKVQLSLEGGTPPAFTMGPAFPDTLRTGTSFGMDFALDKPSLLIYAVFRVLPIDANGKGQAPVLVATGRVPVFDAALNATTGAISACPWAPGGPMTPTDQFLVTYVARDKYGRTDGLCPGQAPGSAPRVCSKLAFA